MPNIRKGSYMVDLLVYLAGKGRRNEHRDQRVIAGDVVTEAVFRGPITPQAAASLARLLDSPRQTVLRGAPVSVVDRGKVRKLVADGVERAEAVKAATSDHNTWHCSLTLKPEEGQLSEETWAAISHDFMELMGFAHREDGTPDTRWAVVHHGLNEGGGDHVHIAMGVVRPDGSIADLFRDHVRAQRACNQLEHKYGLQVLASRESGGTERATKPAERARRDRIGAPETDREAMQRRVRALAIATGSEAEWIRELRAAGVLAKPRFTKGGESVGGCSFQMRPQVNRDGKLEKAIEYSGGYLAKDLTLPSIRGWAAWDRSPQAEQEALREWRKSLGEPAATRSGIAPSDERAAIEELGRWSAYMRTIPESDHDAWAQAASRTSGVFAAASVRTETKPGPLNQMARQLARAGQLPAHRRRPQPVHGSAVRAVARMAWGWQSQEAGTVALMYALTECLLTVRDMLDANHRATEAAAMTLTARRALTEIHMRRDGIDPTRPYVREEGSPPWAAAYRAAVVVDRGDRTEAEADIAETRRAWEAQRLSDIGMVGRRQVDEHGHIVAEAATTRQPVPGGRTTTPQARGRARELGTDRTGPDLER
ncbi:relaxase/mobilization nuclease domain-containing protein [Nocardia takedensis]|uniref:relaxase/mobilization nuclease domain-containing protein n=1 Tax=Nocardia takedensis TaxID=259390 RepID=UPI000301BBFF|nr:hypothetical protein [Nocardia takedensis]